MKTFLNKYGVATLLGVIFIFMMILNMLNEGTHGGGDSYMHHMFAKWSFVHPRLLFDHWGKPLFTILSAPFAQFGFKGSVMFNIIIAILSGVLVAKSAKKMGVENSWLAILLTVFSPMFFVISFSSLTEILFAFVLIVSIYLFISEKYIWSAIVISFIPFARTEGVIFLPLFFLAYLFLKEYKSIGFLLTGFLLMAIAGYPVYNDWLWPITKNPYHDSSALYGNGNIWHFIDHSPAIFGWPLIISFGIGLVTLAMSTLKSKSNHLFWITFLIVGCSIGYFMAHSVVWAFGMGGSAGLTRVMAGIIPVLALIGIIGVDYLLKTLKVPSKIINLILGVLAILFVIEGYTKNKFPLVLGQEEVVMLELRDFIESKELTSEFIVYYSPFEAFILGLDHFDGTNSRDRVNNIEVPSTGLKENSIIIWDGHYAPNEGGLPKENLLNDSELELIAEFKPVQPFQSYGGHDYEILVFQKVGEKVE